MTTPMRDEAEPEAAGRTGSDIVVGVDGSESSRHALRWGIAEARLRSEPVRVVHAWLPPLLVEIESILLEDDISSYQAHADEVLASMLPDDVDDVAVEGRTVQAEPPIALLAELADGGGLLVVGSRGRGGFSSLLLGSVSEHCASQASGPVVVVPDEAPLPDDRDVVVGVDGSEGSLLALDWAIDEAALRGVTLAVVNAWWNPYWVPALGFAGAPYAATDFRTDSEALLREVVDDALGRAESRPPRVELAPAGESASLALLERAKEAGLLVVGSRGRGALAGRLLGSVSQQCLRHAPCAVAVIPLPTL